MSKIIITSGPTHEPIDPVRYIGNNSSGMMGAAIAKAFIGEDIVVISGPVNIDYGCRTIEVQTAEEMFKSVLAELPADVFVSVAAVADKRPKQYSSEKIKKENINNIELVENTDILETVSSHPRRPKIVVGFAAESENHIENARKKLTKKSCDLIVANDISAMNSEENEVWLVSRDEEIKLEKSSKDKIAEKIVKYIGEINGRN